MFLNLYLTLFDLYLDVFFSSVSFSPHCMQEESK